MKYIQSKILIIICLSLSFTLSGCAELFDCIASTRPELPSKNFSLAYFGQPYEDMFTASVVNDPNDNAYSYYFTVDGQLPPGIDYDFYGREIVFSGSPTASGTFTFTVHLTISYPDSYDEDAGLFEDDNRICFGNDSTSKSYTIIVQ